MTSIFKTTQATAPLGQPISNYGNEHTQTAPLDTEALGSDFPELKVSRPLKIATGISSNTKQHVIFAADTSTSMSGHKIGELNIGLNALFGELAAPQNKDGFRGSLVQFSSGAKRLIFAESFLSLTAPTLTVGGGTNFDKALTETIKTVQDFASLPNTDGWQYMRPQVLFLSDGHSAVSSQNIQLLQEYADVTAIAYGADANSGTLSKIASDGRVHVIGTNGGELRKFLADVGQTLSQNLSSAR